MKVHRVLVEAVAAALTEIFLERGNADKVIEAKLKSNRQWGARDRAFIATATYDIVRNYRYYSYAAGTDIADNRLPDEATLAKLISVYYWVHYGTLPAGNILIPIDEAATQQRLQADLAPAIRYSIPDDWALQLATELGDAWVGTVAAMHQVAPIVLRCNTLKTNLMQLQKALANEGIPTQPVGEDALVLAERKNLFATKSFKNGLFEVQDYASQQVAPYMGVQPGMRVIDACSGAGGKALHIAALLQNKGQLIAMDTAAHKLSILQQRARRAGVSCLDIRPLVSTKVVKRLHESADRVLLDVPCSGLGVLRRNPDTKWKLSMEDLPAIRELQQTILQQYAPMVKKGGQLVYATCSILPSENSHQVQNFLAEHSNYTLLKEQTLLPQDFGYDGFYMASLQRN